MSTDAAAWTDRDALSVNAIRMLSADMVDRAKSGHPGMPMGFAQPAHVLWTRFLRFNPDNPFWPARDRFILSCGHGSALIYSLLHLAGYDLSMDDLKQFRQIGSKTPGHPEFGVTPGVETTTGPLGQGVGNGIGMAMAQRYVRESLGVDEGDGFDPLDHFIYIVASDGDLQEGVSAEASSLAGRQKLGRVIMLYDDNGISIDGSTDLAWLEDVNKRYEAYGWHTQAVDGGDPDAVAVAIQNARAVTDKPSIIKVRTHIGYGSPTHQDKESAHGAPLGAEENAATRKALGWEHDPFEIPDDVYDVYAHAADRGRAEHETWLAHLETWLNSRDGRRDLWDHLVGGSRKEYVTDELPLEKFETGSQVPTRKASGIGLDWIAGRDPGFFGGCADLAGSVHTIVDGGPFLPETRNGRNIHFGIREHGMGSVANGIALYGSLRPYTGTFLIFSDYMRPSIRLAALMNLPVIFVFSHDSIGVGEDGPTHQPVEHYAALRAIPNLDVFRPGDAQETLQAWRAAYDRHDGPTAIITSRQKMPVHDRSGEWTASAETLKGGYTLISDDNPQLILLASGSELGMATAAREKLRELGARVRVVSMPCWERFACQPLEYRNQVLPPEVKARVSVEVGIGLGWERWVGAEGTVFSLERFGESGPGGQVFEHLGFTVDRLVQTAREVYERHHGTL